MIINADCLEALVNLDDNSVDSIVTDPPYGIAFMGKKWDYEIPTVALWREVLRVLKPGGHALIACGTRTQHRMAVNIEDAGFEIRDVITWMYGVGFPKSLDISKAIDKAAGAEREVVGKVTHHDIRNGSLVGKAGLVETNITAPSTDAAKQWQGFGTALKPACEFWTLARKPLSESTVAKNVLKHGCGGLNIDASRVSNPGLRGNPCRANGTVKRTNGNTYGEHQDSPSFNLTQGRFPANLILDEEAARLLDLQSGNKCGAAAPVRKKQTPSSTNLDNFKPHTSVGDDGASFKGDSGGASRFFYTAKASKSERNAGLEGMPEKLAGCMSGVETRRDRPPNHTMRANHHPTVKPIKLMEYLCRLITRPGGLILDPFCGSGSTGVAAIKLGFKFIGIEREAEYVEIAKKRINNIKGSENHETKASDTCV